MTIRRMEAKRAMIMMVSRLIHLALLILLFYVFTQEEEDEESGGYEEDTEEEDEEGNDGDKDREVRFLLVFLLCC
jgi:hypothetical protein